jgi:phage regulator Rha-like protein
MKKPNKKESVENMIYTLRGVKVMLDSDLARLYEVETKMLNRAVKRNMERFPEFFMFQLTDAECEILRCQFGTAKISQKRRFNPYVFTEHGILMLSSVLNSPKAIQVNIQIMMAFIQMRRYTVSQPGNIEQIEELRKLLMLYIESNDKRVNEIIIALNNLLPDPPPKSKPIGFKMG